MPRAQVLTATLLVALFGVTGRAAADGAPDDMSQRLRACTACHGKEGRASSEGYLPRIAGKPAGYLYNQLVAFRDGLRPNAAMQRLLDPLSDAYLREIAAYFASLDLPYPPPQVATLPDAVRSRGERLVRDGDASLDVPACTRCHGDAMTGLQPSVPGLLGLPRDYLVAQLGAWRTGLRRTREPDCMATIARRLSHDDVAVMASWLAAQAPPVTVAPTAKVDRATMPLECAR